MRLASRLFVFASTLFIVLYGVLPGLFKIEGEFVAFYVAGANFLRGIDPSEFYRFPVFQRLIDLSGHAGKMFPFSVSTPSSIVAAALIALPPISIARIAATLLSIASFVIIVPMSAKLAGSSTRLTYAVFLSSSYALASNFQSGQPTIILTLLIVMAFYSWSIGSVAACGAFLGIAFPFNPFFVIPAILFLLSAKWRAFYYFLAASLVVLAVTYITVGSSAFVYYLQRILPAYLNGRIMNPFSDNFQTAWSFFRKLFLYNETLNPHPLLRSDVVYLFASSAFKAAVCVPPTYFFYKALSAGKMGEALAAASFPLIFLLPALSSSSLFLLAPAILILAQAALNDGRNRTSAAFAVLYAIACLPVSSIFDAWFGFSGMFLAYEQFFFLVSIYVMYLVFQARLVPSPQRPARLALTALTVAAVTVTLFLGERKTQGSAPLPLSPVLGTEYLENSAFSPGVRRGEVAFVSYDSAASLFTARGFFREGEFRNNIYRYSSGRNGINYSTESVVDGSSTVRFTTRWTSAFFRGHDGSLSPDEDYGAYISEGKIHILDIDPRYVSPVDSLSFLPFRIEQCSFNYGENNEISFLIDSLGSSYSVGTYNLFNRNLNMMPVPFPVSRMCASRDTFFVTEDVADTTILWRLVQGEPPRRLLSVRGNIYDVDFLGTSLLISSDFGRGLFDPTIYRYTADGELHGASAEFSEGMTPKP